MGARTKKGFDLRPAVGARAILQGIRGDPPYILDYGIIPRSGHSVIPSGSSFVTWANMEVNERASVAVTPPAGMKCVVSPGISADMEDFSFALHRDSVTVISFIC